MGAPGLGGRDLILGYKNSGPSFSLFEGKNDLVNVDNTTINNMSDMRQ